MNRTKLVMSIAVSLFFCVSFVADTALAIPVILTGYVADLAGTPHTAPNITITVRTFAGGRVIARAPANPTTGRFEIPIDPIDVPDADTRLQVEASGTATIGGQVVRVETRQPLIGIAGEIAAGLMPASTATATYFFVLVVPKKVECSTSTGCHRADCLLFRGRRRCR